jgi:hypothetical protein
MRREGVSSLNSQEIQTSHTETVLLAFIILVSHKRVRIVCPIIFLEEPLKKKNE